MAIEMNVLDNRRNRRRSKPLPFHFFLLAFFLPALLTFFVQSQSKSIFTLAAAFGINRNFVHKYETHSVRFSSNVSESTQEGIKDAVDDMEMDGKKRFSFSEKGDLEISYSFDDIGNEIYTSYLVPVGHLYWIKDSVESEDFEGSVLISSSLDGKLGKVIREKFPKANFKSVEDLLETLNESEETFALTDFSELDHKMKLLTLDGKYFLDDSDGGVKYSLSISSGGNEHITSVLKKRLSESLGRGFDENSIAKLNMTGVTAITRGLAGKVDSSGRMGYPAEKISDFLKDADLVHVSNEVSFVPGCAPSDGMRFCSRPEYIKALEDIGTNIVSLTGNHNNDYGAQYNLDSLKMYEDRGWDYYGGGKDIEDASKILYKEVNGTIIAFLGYNYYDTMLGTFALAGTTRAGSNSYSDTKMEQNIKEAKENADVVIVDFQFQECYSYPAIGAYMPLCYRPLSSPDQKGLFRKAVDYGADIIVGVQAHQPQTYEIYNGKLIFYGLGNIFFDQILWPGTRHGLILTHYFYEGEFVQTKITTTDYGRDMQPFVTEGDKRVQLLEFLKNAR